MRWFTREATVATMAAALVAAFAAACGGSEQEKPYTELLVGGITSEEVARPLCSSYARTFETWRDRGGTAESFARDISQLALKRLEPFARAEITPRMLAQFTADSLFVCRLDGRYERTRARLAAAADRGEGISARVRWYPEEWSEHGDGIAYRWLTYGTDYTCDYSDAYCWGIEVMARDGCESALYAEIEIQDASGAAIDASNDTLGRLAPKQVGRLVFDWDLGTHDTEGLSGEVADIRCL